LTGVPVDITIECDEVSAPANPIASDNCDTNVDITFDETRVDGPCPDSYTLTRTWTATDNCGNTVSESQTVTVQDVTDPVLAGVPADVTIECDLVPVVATPIATDNCDTNVDITFVETRIDGPCVDSYTLERTWTATDNCGNTVSESQTITLQDVTDPVLSGVPADVQVQCDAIPSAPQVGSGIQATDNCDTNVDVSFDETVVPGSCIDGYILIRTWTATDNCGNQVVETQEITVEDTTSPVITGIPSDASVDCDEIPPVPNNIAATDNCDTNVEITFTEVVEDGGCSNNFVLTRTWTAVDNCGNETVATQRVEVGDGTAPELVGVPANATYECDDIPAPANPMATDNCDTNVDITFDEVRIDGPCVDNYSLVRTWTATDNCGNATSQEQVLTIQDTQAPILTGVPADITAECNNIPDPATPIATDNCDTNVDIEFEEVSTGGACGGSAVLTRRWTATDNCGNQIVETQTITVNDDTPPVLAGVPTDVTVECDAIPAAATPVATDECDTNVEILFNETRTDGPCVDTYTLTRTWTATDDCGNATSEVQTITVEDTQAPILTGVPADLTVGCMGVPPASNATVIATDNCDTNVGVQFEEVRTDGACQDSYTLTRTWTATDNCGNEVSESQTIVVEDTADPVLAGVPSDITVNCLNIPAPATLIATDDCDANVDIIFDESRVDGSCVDSYTLIRTWTATDNCGNSVSEIQNITVEDTENPIISGVPADITLDCNDTPDSPSSISVIATDNCDTNVEITFEEVRVDGGCPDNYTLERTWTATDNCGNQVSETQIITVGDNEAPILSGGPIDVTVDCNNIPPPATLTATDDCDTNVDITFNESRIDGPCVDSYQLIRTWTATDDCGQSTEEQQVLTVTDEIDPELIGVPADLTIDLAAGEVVPPPANPIATDNCDTNVDIEFVETLTENGCSKTYTRVWTATDNCGNQVSETQIINATDGVDIEFAPLNPEVCEGETIPFVVTPLDPNFTYQWTATGGSFNDPNIGNPIYTASDEGDLVINVSVSTPGGCTTDLSTTIKVIGTVDGEVSVNEPICEGDDIQLTASGGTNYEWSGPNGFTSTEQNPILTNAQEIQSGQYFVTISEGICSYEGQVNVVVNKPPRIDYSRINVGCNNLGSITVGVTGGSGVYTFDWADIPGTDDPKDRFDLVTGIYSFTVTDSNGCSV